jgi:hypothetical protein
VFRTLWAPRVCTALTPASRSVSAATECYVRAEGNLNALVYRLFHDPVSKIEQANKVSSVNSELETVWKEAVVA